jgi:hypothetical protein
MDKDAVMVVVKRKCDDAVARAGERAKMREKRREHAGL